VIIRRIWRPGQPSQLFDGTESGKAHTLQYNVGDVRKDTALSFRVPRRLKADLEKVALSEGRSLSQVCEALLAGALDVYRKEGAKYLKRLLSRQKKDASEQLGLGGNPEPTASEERSHCLEATRATRLQGRTERTE
jgi:hypothetical protein